MKKAISLILALALCLALCACAETGEVVDSPTEEVTESAETRETSAPEYYGPVFFDPNTTTYEDIEAMVIEQSNRHNLNYFCSDENWIYGPWVGEAYTGEVAKVRYDNSDWTVIDSNTNYAYAYCVAAKDGYLYYLQTADENYDLIKVRSSGEDPRTIIMDCFSSVQIVGDDIYYTTAQHMMSDNSGVTMDSCYLYRCDLNGENEEAILEKPVYYFTVFNDNYILYQDDKDDVTLHIYDMKTGEDTRLNDRESYCPIYDGNYVYYLTSGSDTESRLRCMTLDGTTDERVDLGCTVGSFLLRGDYIYYLNLDDNNRVYRCLKDGSERELITQESNIYTIQWVGDLLEYVALDDEGYIDGFYLCNADGSGSVEFCKSNATWNFD